MKKKILFVLFLILVGTYEDEVKATNERGFVTVVALVEKPSPPKFVKELEDVFVRVGDNAVLYAVVTGNPMPKSEYFKNGESITFNKRYEITENFGKITIMIKNVRQEDAGIYGIVATNPLGSASTECRLIVTEE